MPYGSFNSFCFDLIKSELFFLTPWIFPKFWSVLSLQFVYAFCENHGTAEFEKYNRITVELFDGSCVCHI